MVLENLITCKGCRIPKKPIEFQSTRREDGSFYVYPKCKLCYSSNELHRGFAVTLRKCVCCERPKQPCDYDGTRDTCRKCVTFIEVAARKVAHDAQVAADSACVDDCASSDDDYGDANADEYEEDSFCDLSEDDSLVEEVVVARVTRSRSCVSDEEGKHDGPLAKKSRHTTDDVRDLGRSYRM